MITAIGDVMRKCYDRGWITTRDGNISLCRKGSSVMHITPAGVRKNKIEVESLVKITMQNGGLIIPENTVPSGELYMHYFLQRGYEGTRAVVHVHATHIVAAMYAGWDLKDLAAQFPEVSRYTRVASNVPNVAATSMDLANATAQALLSSSLSSNPADLVELQYDIVGQANHGVCAVARHPWEAYEHIERLNHICEMVLLSGAKPPTSQALN